MKAILCLAMVIFSYVNCWCQPLILEWERTFVLAQDTLCGLEGKSIAEDPYSHRIILTGLSFNCGSLFDDSSDALIMCLSSEGDSLWTKIYDGQNVQFFDRTAFYPNGDILVGGNAFWHFRLNSDGDSLSSFQLNRGGIGWACWDLDILNNGNILSTGEVFNMQSFLARLYMLSPTGDSLWSITFPSEYWSYVDQIQVLSDNEIELRYHDPIQSGVLLLSAAGDTLGIYPDGENYTVLIYENGDRLGADRMTDSTYFVTRRDLNNSVINQFTAPILAGMRQDAIELISGGMGFYSWYHGWFVGFSEAGEEMFREQLADDIDDIIPLHDGYLATSHSNDGSRVARTTLRKYSVEVPYPVTSDNQIDFGHVMQGEVRRGGLFFSNAGPDSITVDSIVCPDGYTGQELAGINVNHREQRLVLITFAPTAPELYEGDLQIYNNTQWSPITVHLIGDARISEVTFDELLASEFDLAPPYPNPFNPTTTLTFALAHNSEVQLNVFDIQGRLVSKVVRGNFAAGEHSVNWSCAECASGIYFATMNAGSFTASQKLLLLK